jgi:hypothetical protein
MKYLEFFAFFKLRNEVADCCYSLVPGNVKTLVSMDYPIATGRKLSSYELFILAMLKEETGVSDAVSLGFLGAGFNPDLMGFPYQDQVEPPSLSDVFDL